MASYVLLATFVIGTIWIFLSAVLDQTFEADGARALLKDAKLASLLLEDAPSQDIATLDAIADRIASQHTAHVLVFSAAGQVLGDSARSPDALQRSDAVVSSKDIHETLARGHHLNIEADAGHILATVKVNPPRGGPLLLQLTLNLDKVRASPNTIWSTLSIAAFVAVLVAGILGFIASRFFSRPLTELGGVALQIARGDFSSRVNYPVADELGLLGDSLDHLSNQLSEKLRLLTEEKTRLSTILNSMAEGVFVVNTRGKVVLINPAVCDILGVPAHEIEGRPVEEISQAPALAASFARTLKRQEAFVDEFTIPQGQNRLDVMTSIAPIEEDGRLLGMVAVLNDISRVRRLERPRFCRERLA